MQQGAGTVAAPDQALGSGYWNCLFRREDPWNYASAYEQKKYAHTLEMIPSGPQNSALEVGCAEGLFTAMLCPRVLYLLRSVR